MPFHLALVTGASSGIGEALSCLLASKGIELIITGRDPDKLEILSKKLGGAVAVERVVCDLSNPSESNQLLELIRRRAPDLVINNAGFGLYGNALALSAEEQLKMVDVNAKIPLEITLEAAKALKMHSKKGVILNVASAAVFQPCPYLSVYAATKAFLLLLSESLDNEFLEDGIRVLTACPGQVSTEFQNRAAGKVTKIDSLAIMDIGFAANEIWKQIQKGKTVHLFDWRYRLARRIVQCFLSRRLAAKFVKKSIAKRL